MGQTLPYFSFYPKDFHCDPKVKAMTYEQRGIYINLLWMAWEQNEVGTLPCEDGDEALIKWLGISLKRWNKHRDAVMAAFSLESDGRWHQKRMKLEYAKAKTRSEAATKNIQKRWKKQGVGNTSLNTDVLPNGNTIASDLICSDLVPSFPRTPDPNGPLPATPRFIDRRNPPFRAAGLWAKEDTQQAVKEWLKYREETHGFRYTHHQFNSFMNRFEQVKTAKEIRKLVDESIANSWKKIVFPDERGPV